MPAHEQELKYQSGEAEVVVIGGSSDAIETRALQLRWRVLGGPNLAEVALVCCHDLKRVAVDEDTGSLVGNRRIPSG